MAFLRFLGWLFVPYIMIFVRWKKIGGAGKAFGTIWAVIALIGGIVNASNNSAHDATPASSNAVQTSTTSTNSTTPSTSEQTKTATTTPAKTEPVKNDPPKNDPTMSKDEFDHLKSGMTHDEVTKIVGSPGELQSETGSKGDQYHTEIYGYKGEGSFGANAILMFQDEKLESKTQIGLK